jgi:aerobic carbon-monoxide dehydrogenase large subunit
VSEAAPRTREPAFGRALPRREDRPFLTGAGAYVDDLPAQDAVEVAFLRSPFAHGRILRVDGSTAAAEVGVVAVVTAAELDVPGLHPPVTTPGAFSPPRPLLAGDVVRFVGEPLALVAAENRYFAEDALDLIDVEIEPLDPIVNPRAAAEGSHPPLHPAHDSNVYLDWTHEVGDVDAAFAAAAVVVERRLRNPRYSAVPIETRGVLARPDRDGVLVWTSTQAPHRQRSITAELLGLPLDAVRVACPDVGGGFGQKAHVYPEEILVAWLAIKLGRAVKWIEDRNENILASSHARDQDVVVRAAADAEGRLLAVDADIVCDQGAYGSFPHGPVLEALGTPALVPGPYRLPAIRLRSRAVATTKCPEGAYRGVGLVVSSLIHERLMDVLAGELGLDRAEIRRRNMLTSAELPCTTVTNQRYDSGDYVGALDAALAAIDYAGFPQRQQAARSEGRLRGLGFASYVEFSGLGSRVFQGRGMVGILGTDGAHVLIDEQGRTVVWTTTPAIGQGSETTFAQLAADALGLDLEDVIVKRSDTGIGGLEGTGSFASRSAISGGGAIVLATNELRRRLLEDAARRLEIAVDDLELYGGAVNVVGSPSIRLRFAELAAGAEEGRYRISEQYDPPHPAYPYATHACEVLVDPETGHVTIERYVIVEDCGRIINPTVAHGQTIGATVQGIGGALLEEVVYDAEGQLVNASLMDYLAPTAGDVPSFELHTLETPAPDTPLGVKGVGEGGTLAPPGALANAVGNAVGAEFNELPLTPERVAAAAWESTAA